MVMFTTGITIFLGVTLILVKLPRRLMLRLLKHDIVIDVAVSAAVLSLHWGTFSGIMAATLAGLLTSVATTFLKRLFGHIDGNIYYPGIFALKL
jgi:nucleoside permease NupC